MAFIVKKSRKCVIEHQEGEDYFKATFDFICTEDIFTDELIDKLTQFKNTEPSIAQINATMWHSIRRSLVDVEGIIDEEGNPFSIRNADGTINDELQRAAFEFIVAQGNDENSVREKLKTAYNNLNQKNSKPGATQPLTGNGDQ